MSPPILAVSLAALLATTACQRRSEEASESLGTIRLGTHADPKFDEAWRALSKRDGGESELFYIEDDRGEGLMGRVHRASRAVPPQPPPPPATKPQPAHGEPDMPAGEAVTAAIRSNFAGIKACYLRVTREGRLISGRAILSFTVEKDGSAKNVRVEGPAFEDSTLPRCISQQVERWSFPRSKRGGFAVSYPFVFVSG